MGWDAYAVRPEVDPGTSEDEFLTTALQERFRRASQELEGVVGNGSDNLGTGTLGGLSQGILGTGIPDYDETSADGNLLWSPDIVRRAQEQANREFEHFEAENEEFLFLVAEARIFLRVCASQRLAIWFDW